MGGIAMQQLLHLAFLTSVSAHGGVLWPPTWQAGVATPIKELNSEEVFSDPLVHDPKTGQPVKDIKSWLTDQAYTGGVGDEFRFVGPVTNHEEKCGVRCVEERNPKDKDKRPPGSACGQKKVDGGRGGRGTSSFGTDARLFDFPQMITTEWQVGSVQDVAWSSRGGH